MTELSLLWPNNIPTETTAVSAETIRDLELETIVQAISSHTTHHDAVRSILFQLCQEEETIRFRQIVLKDFEAHPKLVEGLKAVLPMLSDLTQFTYRKIGRGNPLEEVVARARELELLVETTQLLEAAFTAVAKPLKSTALNALHQAVHDLVANPQFQAMASDLPGILKALRSNASITIGVNLDDYLRPEAAVLLAVNQERFTESTLLERLLGKEKGQGRGIAPLHRPPAIVQNSPTNSSGSRKRLSPLMVPLFKDLAKVLERVSEPIAQDLQRYVQLNGRFLAKLRPELTFYIDAFDFIQSLQAAGLRFTYPNITSTEERICQVNEAFNLQLAVQRKRKDDATAASVVTNDIGFDNNGRIAILTGPNQGGKTTFMQSVGLVQVLAQVGLPVPGTAAHISLADQIFTHYPIEEQLELGTGRFGDEAQRIRAIFEKATRHSLLLLNESLATTSMGEGTFLARDIVRAFRQIGLRAIFTTHMHELATAVDEINNETEGDSLLFSLVASKPEGEREEDQAYSYRVQPAPPLGRSYAENIAARYGISNAQLQALLQERGLSN